MLVPGLTQLPAYARAVFQWAKLIPEELVEARVRARMDRQALTKRLDPPQLTFFVLEYALRSMVGDRRVMQEQLLHLVFLTSRPQFEIRVVPADAGPTGSLGGGFMLMRYEEHRPVVYAPSQTTSVFLEKRQDIDTYRAMLNRLGDIALDVGQSRQFLAQLASEFEEHDDRD